MIKKIAFVVPVYLGILGLFASPVLADNPALNVGTSVNTSRNWSGYVANGGTDTAVGGSWIVPQASGSNIAADATWVGIGGVTSNDLIQVGTQAIIQNGTVQYQAWYELLPAYSQSIPITIHPGDSVTASILQVAANTWSISFRDTTSNQNYQTTVTYNSSLSSAEWVEEMPTYNNSFLPLDTFGTVQFSNAWVTKNGLNQSIGLAGGQPLSMINSSNQILATPSSLGSDNASFSVTRTSAVAIQTTTIGRQTNWRRTGVGIQTYQPRTVATTTPLPTRFFIGRSFFVRFNLKNW